MIKKKELVVQSNRIVEACYRLTLTEQRIILYAAHLLKEEEETLFEGMPVYIDAKSFCERFPDVNITNAYNQLIDAMDTLYERSVTFKELDEDGHLRVTKTRWLSSICYVDEKGRIEVIFTGAVVKQIANVKREFTRYNLREVSQMSSGFAVRIFQLLYQYKDIGKRTIKLGELREALMIPDDEYKLTAHLISRVIDPAIKQINSGTSIKVSYEVTKDSRKIDGFFFKIKDKTKAKPEDSEPKEPKPKKPADQAERDKLEAMGQTRIDDFDQNLEF